MKIEEVIYSKINNQPNESKTIQNSDVKILCILIMEMRESWRELMNAHDPEITMDTREVLEMCDKYV